MATAKPGTSATPTPSVAPNPDDAGGGEPTTSIGATISSPTAANQTAAITLALRGSAFFSETPAQGATQDHISSIVGVRVQIGQPGASPSNLDALKDGTTTFAKWKLDVPVSSVLAKAAADGSLRVAARAKVQVQGQGPMPTGLEDVVTFKVDKQAPALSVTSHQSGDVVKRNIAFTLTGLATDSGVGAQSVQVKVGTAAPQTAGTFPPLTTPAPWSRVVTLTQLGQTTISITASDHVTNAASLSLVLDALDPLAGAAADLVTARRYLADLVAFSDSRVFNDTASGGSGAAALTTFFCQPYGNLSVTAAPNVSASEGPVALARVAVEILRKYLASRVPSQPANLVTLLAQKVAAYLEAAYAAFLRGYGASLEDLRLATGTDAELLAERLGLDPPAAGQPSPFLPFILTGGQLTETALESRFGLIATTRDSFGAAPPKPLLLTRQLAHLRTLWDQQDRASRAATPPAAPILDPDIVRNADLNPNAPNQNALTLLTKRAKLVEDILDKLRTARNSSQNASTAFAAVVDAALGAGQLAKLDELAKAAQSGDISAELAERFFTTAAFDRLIRLEQLAATGTLLDREWEEVFNILVEVGKRKEHGTWRTEEQDQKIVLSPDFFIPPAPGAPPPVLPVHRASTETRRAWEGTLRGRTDQESDVIATQAAVVESTEAEALPLLVRGLLETIGQAPGNNISASVPASNRADAAAEALSRELFFDFKAKAPARTTRLQVATESLQGILFAVRDRTLAGRTAVIPPNPALAWALKPNDAGAEPNFDEEWSWMGAYATWRAAMLAFLFPENGLRPALRLAGAPTQPFLDFLAQVRSHTPLTSGNARAAAQSYLGGLRNSLGTSLPAVLQDAAFAITDQMTTPQLQQWKGIQTNLFGNVARFQDAPEFVQEVFFFVPIQLALELEKAGEFLAALEWYQTVFAYDLPAEQRKICRGLIVEGSLPTDILRSDQWLLGDHLNPHVVARSRANAYTRFTVLSLARCLVAFADDQFALGISDSMAQARALYTSALDMFKLSEFTPPAGGLDPMSNPAAQALKSRAEINLQRLREGRNLLGIELTRERRPTEHRYAELIERARQLTATAQQIESAFLSALEQRDAEAYSLLKARQDVELAGATVDLQQLRRTEAQDGITLAQEQRDRAAIQTEHFEGLIGEVGKMEDAADLLNGLAKGLALLGPQLPTRRGQGGGGGGGLGEKLFGGLITTVEFSTFINPMGTALALAAAAGAVGGYLQDRANKEKERRDWDFGLALGRQDAVIATQEIRLAHDRLNIVTQELNIASLQMEHAAATVEFLASKFTNAELFDWMSGVLQEVYRYFLQQATITAKLAEGQLRFERQETLPSFIQSDYWRLSDAGTDRRGLTGSARLLRDITQLDEYAFQTDRRKLQLAKTFSLAHLAPVAFQRFLETGRLIFATPMETFDRDFPGHYLRLVRRVRTSVIALIPPSLGIRGTLACAPTSRVVVEEGGFRTVDIQHGSQSVALSSPLNATGLFELDLQPNLLLPFEGVGVDTTWEFLLPKPANPFDYTTIADVLLTIEYTAFDSPVFRRQIIQSLDPQVSADRLFSLRHQFADAWYDLHNPAQTTQPMTVRLRTEREDFPPNIDALRIQHVTLFLARADGKAFEVKVDRLRFTAQSGATPVDGGAAISVNGLISTRHGNGSAWITLIGKEPFGEWELELPDTAETRDHFKNEEIEDILFVLTYTGRTPPWPG